MAGSRSLLVCVVSAGVALASFAGATPAGAKPADRHGPRIDTSHALPLSPGGRSVASHGMADKVTLIVHTDSPSNARGVASAAKSLGASVRHDLSKIKATSIEVPADQADAFAARLRARTDVTRVEVAAQRTFTQVPTDPSYAANQAHYFDSVSAPTAWDSTTGSASVTIAVIDSGVDVAHPDLQPKIVGQHNSVAGAPDVNDVTDTLGHGTFVAGVAAAATNNGVGVAGADWNAGIYAVKVGTAASISTDDEAAGIIWATDHMPAGPKVINLSLAGPDTNQAETDAVAYAQNHDVLVVAAAGNETTNTPQYPAAHPGVIAVGATDSTTPVEDRASFSNYGSWVTVAAPGVSIYSTTPTAGSTIWPSGSYNLGDGTSFSTPLVVGEAGLLWAKAPTATAAEIRDAIVHSAHGYSGLGLGTGQVDFNAALAHLAPTTIPTITAPAPAPAPAPAIFGVVDVTATSSAAKVQFYADGTALAAPVEVVTGSATTPWTSWGLANGTHTFAARDCTATNECSTTPSDTVAATLSNAAPVVTAPRSAGTVSGAFTITANSAGGGLAFYIDNVKKGFDGYTPYSLSYSGSALTDGTHTTKVVQCNVAGTTCSGPTSKVITFTAKSLHPTITSFLPSPFSPNGDTRNDTSKLTYNLPDTETVTIQIKNSVGTVVLGKALGSNLAKGTHYWVWDGKNNAKTRVPDGLYNLEMTTRATVNGVLLMGLVKKPVRVDTVAPTMTSVVGNGKTFYPYPDGYADTFVPSVVLNEGGTLTLKVYNSASVLVRSIAGAKPAGRQSLVWNGRNASNVLVPAGTYRWRFTIRDAAGNIRTGSLYTVVVSSKKLVTKTAVLQAKPRWAYDHGAIFDIKNHPSECAIADISSDPSTGTAYSAYGGLFMGNLCPQYQDSTAAFYDLTLPAAIRYNTGRIDVFGLSYTSSGYTGPTTVVGSFYDWTTHLDGTTAGASVNATEGWRNLGSGSLTGRVNGSRVVEIGVWATTRTGHIGNVDLKYVKLTVTYQVLG